MRIVVILLLSSLLLLASVWPAVAHEIEPEEAGHPVRVTAHLLYPAGYILYQGVARPAHWFVSRPGLRQLFGHDRIGSSRSSLAPENSDSLKAPAKRTCPPAACPPVKGNEGNP